MKITFYGHACIGIEVSGKNITQLINQQDIYKEIEELWKKAGSKGKRFAGHINRRCKSPFDDGQGFGWPGSW